MSIIKNTILNSGNSFVPGLYGEQKIFIIQQLLNMDHRFYKITLANSNNLINYPVHYSRIVRRSNFRFSYDRPGSQSIYNEYGS